jgi:hydroxypyruvate reductase
VLARALAEAVFTEAVIACNPARRVRDALAVPELVAWLGPRRLGIAIGKAALAMARGAGPVERGLVVAPSAGEVPSGWEVMVASHPEPDERSVQAGRAVLALVESARPPERILALVSGGASALVEVPRSTLADLRATIQALAATGAPITELNVVRGALSSIKAGELALRSTVPIVTLAISDVIGDDLAVIGSGPTILPSGTLDVAELRRDRRARAHAILAHHGVRIPAALDEPSPRQQITRADRSQLIAPMSAFAEAAHGALASHGIHALYTTTPFAGDVGPIADELVASIGPIVAWGEPTLRLPPERGQGGRAQQLALELAQRLRGTERCALVVGSDGIDGPPPPDRPAPAGAFVHGGTWEAIRARGLDPRVALERCDAGSVLAAVDALVVTGPTGINHADLVLLG